MTEACRSSKDRDDDLGTARASHDWLDRNPKPFVLVYVKNHGAREEIGKLEKWNHLPPRDFLAVG